MTLEEVADRETKKTINFVSNLEVPQSKDLEHTVL